MHKWLLIVVALLLSGCVTHHALPLLLTFSDGTCSGTAIGPHAILTATHCFGDSTVKPAGLTVRQRMDDGDDHTILIVAQGFDADASIAPMPDVGTDVHLLGNPATFRDIYARGYVAGAGENDATLLGLPIFLGDSGAAVMNDAGAIVGVISGVRVITGEGMRIQWAVAKPLRFKAWQWREAMQ